MIIGGPKKNHKKGILASYRDTKRKQAAERQAVHNALTTEQKIAKLDAGGFTASKERKKLLLKQVVEKRTT